MRFDNHQLDQFYDELFQENGSPRPGSKPIIDQINALPTGDLKKRQKAAEMHLLQAGITFNVYGSRKGKEKIFPFDIIPRVIQHEEWSILEKGLMQRIHALNLFIDDIYNDCKILKDGVIPKEVILSAESYRKESVGMKPPNGVWIHVTGTDLIRNQEGQFFVLEDNLRCPSGVSYVLENREVLKQTFPKAFKAMNVLPVHDYPEKLLETLQSLCSYRDDPVVVLLSPGVFNSAYFEHAFLAQQMGIQLVEGRDLTIQGGKVVLRTTTGFEPVDVIYRRVDDDFLDPKEFRPDSMLGVPGLMQAYRNGQVALANAVGTGVADDKAIYAYTPQIIKYYLGEDPIIPIVPTYICSDEKQRQHVLDNIHQLVVKPVNLSGGYGMLIGPKSTKAEQDRFKELIKKNPRTYIAQPTIQLSRAPILDGQGFSGRHVDLRPYILYGKSIHVIPGGLTRVALKPGSLVVNSSQGGGSKDTWILSESFGGQG
ncbi:circularly permuted type 2 ATP-grasp protein [Pseudobacteriovorax antillogorgiicola]|uniref:Uncharacterized conserved protein, circularly permuted ATPgrasp superfamily n=1 Tax=Pseudobacteriovorax antillogorgiicola TaxID=1513793 RepID=A0A1Y6BRU6_9BACT|nr:circularly permuted type 2 ATP-grasp protein [Pseudobacteriovorax antillogorgiicola]TCS53168.1 putative circularly permuted ATP-grasp superfamily protein [Pseudobacteriovorax antillogorgiicola]SMF24913.1 Uncharacterized conserved protein, circularly permuted ATPgrasp superfamily [Pseudobacteriovorax antillogorgiicola]